MKEFFRKDIDKFKYWPLEQNFLDSELGKAGGLKLDQGESAFPLPESIQKILAQVDVRFYPGISEELTDFIAKRDGIKTQNIFLGNGTLDCFELIIRLFVDPDDEVMIFPPTYPMYSYFVQLARGKVTESKKLEDYLTLDMEGIKRSVNDKTKLLVLDRPNNPFGTVVSKAQVEQLLNLGIPTVIDEAYWELSGDTVVDLLPRFPNLICLRTFSKVMGIAGMRLGYVISSEETREALVKVKTPHQVNRVSQLVALKLLQEKELIEDRIKQLVEGREYLFTRLKQFSFLEPYKSSGAYIVAKVTKGDLTGRELFNFFKTQKMLIKKIDFPGMEEGFVRFNAVPRAIANRIIKTLKEYAIQTNAN